MSDDEDSPTPKSKKSIFNKEK